MGEYRDLPIWPHSVSFKYTNSNVNEINDWLKSNIDETGETWKIKFKYSGYNIALKVQFKYIKDKMLFSLVWL